MVIPYELYELYVWGKSSGTLRNFIIVPMERYNDDRRNSPISLAHYSGYTNAKTFMPNS